MRELEIYLDVSGKPEDDLIDLQEARMEGSCKWLAEKASFKQWVDPQPKSPRIYWINANPATGKSVLSGYIIDHLESLNLSCSYYFFRHGDKVKSSLCGFLKSIAYQMASANIQVREKLVSLMDREIRFDKDDERVIWRKLFVLGIFRAELRTQQYWVIDALDECTNTASFFQLISKIEENLPIRILITSRKTTEIAAHFQDLHSQSPTRTAFFEEEISFDNTSGDITLYLQSRMEKLPVTGIRARQELLQKVLDKSSGCFLWVKLVLKELEGSWGQHQIETVLEEVPVDMDPLYTRALALMASKPVRTKELAKAILTWTMCATRPLSLSELQCALKLDIGDNIEELAKAVASLCCQLVYVDKHFRVQMVHQTARAFLLGSDLNSEFAVDSILGHLRLARICLGYLNGEEMRLPRARKSGRASFSHFKRSPLVDYACMSFSEHMRQTASNNNDLLGLLDLFLRTNVLSWIEHVAQTGNLHSLTTTAKIIVNYLDRYAKHSSPLGPKVQRARLWATDLIRLVANFGKKLLEMPSSIYWLIPPFCPEDSAIFKQFGITVRGITLVGLSATAWDDRLACIDYPDTQATALACGETYFAVGLQSGEVVLCHNTTCQEWQRLHHEQPVKLLAFDGAGNMLVTVSKRDIKVWSLATKSIMWHFTTENDVLSLLFAEEDNVLIVATKGNGTISWDMLFGELIDECPWTDAFGDERFRRPPLNAAFSPDLAMLAIVYRGRPISIWDMDDQIVVGFLGREMDLENLAIGTNTSVASLVFSSNPNLGLLAAAYEDGDLALFDPWNRKTIKVIEANSQVVACSPDGCTLLTGNSAGMVQLLEFETLTLLYRINAFDYGVRSLSFSSDGLRFLDVRGQHCNVWEPSILVQRLQKDGEDVVSETLPAEPKIVGVADIDDMIEITTLICHESGEFLFCGKSDGSVCIYHTTTGKQISTLYNHADDIPVTSMCWGEKSKVLITGDAASQLIARQLVYNAGTRAWAATRTLINKRLSVAIDQIVLDPSHSLLLVSADSNRTMWNLSTGAQIVNWEPASNLPDIWINHPSDRAKCLSIRTRDIVMIDWTTIQSTLMRDSTIQLNLNTLPDECIKSVVECSKGQKLAIEISRQDREDSTTKVFIFNTSSLRALTIAEANSPEGLEAPPLQSISPVSDFLPLSSHVEHVIGAYNSKLVFLDRNSWVCSVDLTKRSSSHNRDIGTHGSISHAPRSRGHQRFASFDSTDEGQGRQSQSAFEGFSFHRPRNESPFLSPDSHIGHERSREKRHSIDNTIFDRRPSTSSTFSASTFESSSERSHNHRHSYGPITESPARSPPAPQMTYSRHFFVPASWHSTFSSSSGRKLIIRVSSRGDVIFVRDEECAVVQHGLEFEEIVTLENPDVPTL
jgi:hypothetical protein